jgi:uncharacterized protein (TIGR03437 family)
MELLFSGPGQVNTVLPDEFIAGAAKLVVRRDGWPAFVAPLPIAAVRPGMFTLNQAGLVAASLIRSKPDQAQVWETVFQVEGNGDITARPIVFGEESENLSLVIYCTGVRGRSSPRVVTVQIGDIKLTPSYAGPQPQYAGLDQINVSLPTTLAGAGSVSVRVEVEGLPTNTGWLMFR